MRMREIGFEGQPAIDGYGPGGFRIGEAWHASSVICGPAGVAEVETPLGPAVLDALLALAEQVDLVLVGMGAEIAPLPAALRNSLEVAGLGVEVMATPSACRTYNVLLSEGRRVACVLTAI